MGEFTDKEGQVAIPLAGFVTSTSVSLHIGELPRVELEGYVHVLVEFDVFNPCAKRKGKCVKLESKLDTPVELHLPDLADKEGQSTICLPGLLHRHPDRLLLVNSPGSRWREMSKFSSSLTPLPMVKCAWANASSSTIKWTPLSMLIRESYKEERSENDLFCGSVASTSPSFHIGELPMSSSRRLSTQCSKFEQRVNVVVEKSPMILDNPQCVLRMAEYLRQSSIQYVTFQ